MLSKLTRWSLALQSYNIVFRYAKASQNKVAAFFHVMLLKQKEAGLSEALNFFGLFTTYHIVFLVFCAVYCFCVILCLVKDIVSVNSSLHFKYDGDEINSHGEVVE